MKPRWPPAPVRARSWRSYEKQGTVNSLGGVVLITQTTAKIIFVKDFPVISQLLETFRFEDENDYEYEIWMKDVLAYSPKVYTSESFIVLLNHQKS